MSKFVKNLITQELSQRLRGVNDALLVDVIGMDAQKSYSLRKELREKQISLLVVKNGLAKRAAEGGPLAPAFQGVEGSTAIVWGAEDFVSLVKEITDIDKRGLYEGFQTRGGVMDGERLSPERVKDISKWPNRAQQLSILVGQMLSPGAKLSSQLIGPGGKLASQIEKIAEGDGDETQDDAGATEGSAEGGSAEGGTAGAEEGTAGAESGAASAEGGTASEGGSATAEGGEPVAS